jgi:hypothetical protein
MDAEAETVTRNGREYLVFPVIAAREMVLDYPEYNTKELLSSQRLRESSDMWAGTPLTYIHPENPTRTADLASEYTETVIGQAYDPQLIDNEKLRVQAWIDIEKARDIGGLASDVVDLLQSDEDVSVSAGYATIDDDQSGGKHNGQSYDIEQGYIIPDHIAIFPSDEFQARCSWEDGCGAPRANARQTTETAAPIGGCSAGACRCGFHANARDTARTPSYDGLTSAEWNPPTFTEYVTAYYEQQDSEPPEDITVNTVSNDALSYVADRTLVGTARDPDGAGQVRSYPVVNTDDELNEDALRSARQLAYHSPAEDSIVSQTNSLLAEHSGEWPSGNEYDENGESVNANYDNQTILPTDGTDRFVDEQKARERSFELGCDGEIHSHPHRYRDDVTIHMPCDTHGEYEVRLKEQRESDFEYVTNIGTASGNLRYIRAGEYVQWDTDGETQHGRIRTVVRNGCAEIIAERKCAGANQIVVDIETYSDASEPTGQRVLKYAHDGAMNEDNLRSWDAPRSARDMPDSMRANAMPTPKWSQGDFVHFQGLPNLFGRVEHVADESKKVMVSIHGVQDGSLVDSGFTYSAGYSDVVHMADGDASMPTAEMDMSELQMDMDVDRDMAASDMMPTMNAATGRITYERPMRSRPSPHTSHTDRQYTDVSATDTRTYHVRPRTNDVSVDIGDRTVDLTPPDAVINAAEAGLKAKTETYPDELGDCGTGVGEQRANQIIDGNLAPEDFLTRDNGTPIPTYLDSHESDLDGGIDSTPPNWSEETWLSGCGEVQYSLWGGTGTGTGLNWAEGTKDDLESAIDAAEDFSLNAYPIAMTDTDIEVDDISIRHNVVPFLAREWEMDTALVNAFISALDDDDPADRAAYAAAVSEQSSTLNAVDVQTALADAEGRDTVTMAMNYEPPAVDIDSGVGPHIDAMNVRDHVAPRLASEWAMGETETIAIINALDSDHATNRRALANAYVTSIERSASDATSQSDLSVETVVNTLNSLSADSADTDGDGAGGDTSATDDASSALDVFKDFVSALNGTTVDADTDIDAGTDTDTPTSNDDDTMTNTQSDYDLIEPVRKSRDYTVNAMSKGDTVKWDWSGGTVYGKVKEIVEDGSRTVDGNQRTAEPDDGKMIAVIDQMSEEGEMMDQEVLKYIYTDQENENNLRSWDAPDSSNTVDTDADADTDTDANTNTDTVVNMNTDIKTLAAESAFGVSELEGMTDEQLVALEESLNITNEMHGDGHGGEDEDDEEDEEDEEMMNNVVDKENFESVKREVEELKAMVEDTLNRQANAEKEEHAEIVANAVEGMSKDAALELSSENLESLAEQHMNTANYAGVAGQKDRTVNAMGGGGMMSGGPEPSQEEVEEYPAGGRSNWESRKRSGGD